MAELNQAGSVVNGQTEAPTNTATINNVLPPIGEEKLEFVTICDQHWSTTGTMLTKTRAYIDWGIEHGTYDRFISDRFVQAALLERGIDVKRELPKALLEPESDESKRKRALSPLQLVTANALVNLLDQRSDKKKLQDLGVDLKVHQRWLRDPNYSGYLATLTENMLKDSNHEASLALLDKVKSGDLGAIKLHMELNGRIAKEGAAGDVKDIQLLLTRILEIVVDECDGPTAMLIADRMKEAVGIHAIATDINAEIRTPKVAPMRVMNEQMQALKDKTSIGDV